MIGTPPSAMFEPGGDLEVLGKEQEDIDVTGERDGPWVGGRSTVGYWERNNGSIGRPARRRKVLGRFAVALAAGDTGDKRGGNGLSGLVSMQVVCRKSSRRAVFGSQVLEARQVA